MTTSDSDDKNIAMMTVVSVLRFFIDKFIDNPTAQTLHRVDS